MSHKSTVRYPEFFMCPACTGSGQDDERHEICRRCKGFGSLERKGMTAGEIDDANRAWEEQQEATSAVDLP
jgi:DnaJ-class molecular chaperone